VETEFSSVISFPQYQEPNKEHNFSVLVLQVSIPVLSVRFFVFGSRLFLPGASYRSMGRVWEGVWLQLPVTSDI
jgi:hypothetical protein